LNRQHASCRGWEGTRTPHSMHTSRTWPPEKNGLRPAHNCDAAAVSCLLALRVPACAATDTGATLTREQRECEGVGGSGDLCLLGSVLLPRCDRVRREHYMCVCVCGGGGIIQHTHIAYACVRGGISAPPCAPATAGRRLPAWQPPTCPRRALHAAAEEADGVLGSLLLPSCVSCALAWRQCGSSSNCRLGGGGSPVSRGTLNPAELRQLRRSASAWRGRRSRSRCLVLWCNNKASRYHNCKNAQPQQSSAR
jgi:hypothetical protein